MVSEGIKAASAAADNKPQSEKKRIEKEEEEGERLLEVADSYIEGKAQQKAASAKPVSTSLELRT